MPEFFGVDPVDSARLLELRQAIDSYLGWKSQQDEERGNYVFRVREIGDALWNFRQAHLEHQDPEPAARALLSALRPYEDPDVPLSPAASAALEAGLASAKADIARGGTGGSPFVVAPAEEPPTATEARAMLEVLATYGFDSSRAVQELRGAFQRLRQLEIERPHLAHDSARGALLQAKFTRQRKELRRLNRDAKARALASIERRVLIQYEDKDAARRRLLDLCAQLKPADLHHLADVLSKLGYV